MINYGFGVMLSPISINAIEISLYLRNNHDYNQYFRQVGLLQAKKHEDFLLNQPPDRMIFSIIDEEESCGLCGLTSIDYVHRKAEISCFSEDWKFDKAAIKTIAKFGFEELNLNRIWAETFETHKIHLDILDELGFKREGILRDSYYKNGKYINSIIHSMIKTDEPSNQSD